MQISNVKRIPHDQQKLVLVGKQLEDDRTLAYYNIHKKHLVKGDSFQVCVWRPICSDCRIITLEVESCDTICNLKAKIQDKEGIPQDCQKLIYVGGIYLFLEPRCRARARARSPRSKRVRIQPNQPKLISNCGESNATLFSSELQATLQTAGGSLYPAKMQIFVILPSGRTVTVLMRSTDTIDWLKTIIQKKVGIEHEKQMLTYAGERLDDSCTLANYEISNDSRLHLEILVRIRVSCSLLGRMSYLEVARSSTIRDVKIMMQGQEGIPASQLELYYKEKKLEDGDTVAGHDICNNEILIGLLSSKVISVKRKRD